MAVSASSPPARFAGLDGLRALAVTFVITYHLFPSAGMRSGYLGVDVFFVISGFLITALLLRADRIDVPAFWIRRARRLLPALGLVILLCCSAAWIIGGDVLVGLGRQVAGAVTFSANWTSLVAGEDYFSADSPELFRNFWSLAVEEQFYVLWPLVLLVLARAMRPWRVMLGVFAAALSTVWMTMLVVIGSDPTRAYFGTDSHAFGLLLGATLAFVLEPGRPAPPAAAAPSPVLDGGWRVVTLPPPPAPVSARQRVRGAVLGVTGAAALTGLVWLTLQPPGPFIVGPLALTAVLTAVVIACAVSRHSWLGPALDVAPLRWVGERSYGLYLWHWPVLVLVAAALSAGPLEALPLWAAGLALAITVVAAALSYRFVEMPVRRLGFRGAIGSLRTVGVSRRQVLAPGAVLLAAVVTIGATAAAVVSAPAVTSAEEAVAAGREALRESLEAPTEATVPSPAAEAPDAADPPAPATVPAPTTPGPPAPPVPTPATGGEITAVGDSVMLASAGGLLARFPGIQIDAQVSRQMWSAPGIVRALADAGALRPYLVLALGTNGSIDPGALDEVRQILGPDRRLVLVTAFAPRSWIPGVNADLAAYAAAHPGVLLADWSTAIAGRSDLLAGDHIHPGASGGAVFADVVAATLTQLAERMAREQYLVALREYYANGWVRPIPQ